MEAYRLWKGRQKIPIAQSFTAWLQNSINLLSLLLHPFLYSLPCYSQILFHAVVPSMHCSVLGQQCYFLQFGNVIPVPGQISMELLVLPNSVFRSTEGHILLRGAKSPFPVTLFLGSSILLKKTFFLATPLAKSASRFSSVKSSKGISSQWLTHQEIKQFLSPCSAWFFMAFLYPGAVQVPQPLVFLTQQKLHVIWHNLGALAFKEHYQTIGRFSLFYYFFSSLFMKVFFFFFFPTYLA